ncbi:TonB family protein [Chryseolinea sp. H1M3-3]|uniref:TonB family protein n=1 Tax=Chryseolinea sp. H1M3-3 TaxID=3034144 RepID=UPI0023EAA8A0|nr:TonB family protein [Chryseolinea sp. H1M3-3]
MNDYKNDIDKYLKGELTPAQMHALEKKALDDPFLADALEGFQQLPPEDFAADIKALEASLNKRVHKGNNHKWVWLGRIAAGLLLMAVSTYVIVLLSNRSEKDSADHLAVNKQKELAPPSPSENPAAAFSDSVYSENEKSAEPSSIQEEKKKDESELTPPITSRSGGEQAIAEIPEERSEADEAPKVEEKPVATTEDISKELDAGEKIAAEQQPGPANSGAADRTSERILKNDDLALARKKTAPAAAKAPSNAYNENRKVIRGKVTFADDGTGLPGVNVLVKGSNEGTVTDANGNYQIPVADDQSTLLFSFIGFASKEVETTDETTDVQLEADVSELSEVVVVGYVSASEANSLSSPTPPVMELAAPAGGRRYFKKYLEENLRYPEQALKNEVEGKVTVQFSIGTTGQLSDFRIIRGIGHGCDEEVIRLIKEGPKWAPTKRNDEPIRDRARVRMRFSLPKK